MNKTLVKEMNDQINRELFSAYLYLAMSAYFESESLDGFAHWMKIQASEEFSHAMKFYNFIGERGEIVELESIDKPDSKFSSVQDIFEKTLTHEKFITKSINDLYVMAQKDNDNASIIFLDWFVTEQVEEEKNPSDILGKLKYIGKEGNGILMMDKELSARALPTFLPSGEIAGE